MLPLSRDLLLANCTVAEPAEASRGGGSRYRKVQMSSLRYFCLVELHQKYLRRCIQLGQKALATAAPNPGVGCVVVHNNTILAEGYTSPYGGPHAEVNALKAVADTRLLSQATLYVTLEPCAHHGKTPPCADLITQYRIPHVVIGIQDPHDKVAGLGIQKLREAGCELTVGILEKECRQHHKRFLTYCEKKRPYVILKWAETQDGFIAPSKVMRNSNPEPFWITNAYSQQRVHQWRSEEQAILVGTRTVLEDNPKLTVRRWTGTHPIRVILDRNLKIPPTFHVMDTTVETLVLTQVSDVSQYREGIAYEVIDFSKAVAVQIAAVLYNRGITSVLVEGGTQTLQTFIDEEIWDEARVFNGPTMFGHGVAAPKVRGKLRRVTPILSDTLSTFTKD